jgi:hypothetical protein
MIFQRLTIICKESGIERKKIKKTKETVALLVVVMEWAHFL